MTADLEMRIQAFESKYYRRMLGISYGVHKTNEYVWQGHQELLLPTVVSYHGSAMSIVMIMLPKINYEEQ